MDPLPSSNRVPSSEKPGETPTVPNPSQPPDSTTAPLDMSHPARIGKFRIIGIIAETQLSIVYHAEDTELPRQVALKLPRGRDLSSPEAQSRFRDEMALAARLDQQSVVPILESGSENGVPYFAMQLLHGRPIDEHADSVALELEDRIALFRELCRIVGHLHKDGILHLDLKPRNFLVDRHGAPRLLDFGLAATREVLARDTARAVSGTPRYMAPEQTFPDRQHQLTTSADVYALGTIFYHLLTGRFPYSLEGSPESCVESIRRAIPRPPSALNPKVPPALNTLVLRALDKDPTKRFQDAEELGRELELLSPRARISPPSSRRKLTPIIGGAVALLAGVAALAFAMSREQPAPMQVNVATSATTVPLSDQRVRKYSPTQLATLAAPTSAVAAVPKALWPVYRQALDDVQNVEEHRLSGALLVDVRALQKGGSVRLRSVQGSEQIEETSFAPGDSLIILVPAGHTYILECVTPDGIVKFKAAITSGEVIYWQPKPNAPDPKVKASAV